MVAFVSILFVERFMEPPSGGVGNSRVQIAETQAIFSIQSRYCPGMKCPLLEDDITVTARWHK
jgi:hypothetical protein